MADERSIARDATWPDFFSWLLFLGRSFRLATALRVLLLSALGLIGTAAGWRLIGVPFREQAEDSKADARRAADAAQDASEADSYLAPDVAAGELRDELEEAAEESRAAARARARAAWPWEAPEQHVILPGEPLRTAWSAIAGSVRNPFFAAWNYLSAPFREMFDDGINWKEFLYLFLCAVWALMVWALFGGAISRITAVALTREDRLGLWPALKYAQRKWPSYFSAPLFPIIGAFLIAIPVLVVGLLFHFDVGVIIASILWVLVLLAAFVMAVILVGLAFGWPLMWGTISTEGTDSFDAMSRSYAYVFQRPLHYFFYVLVASIVGILGLLVVSLLAWVIINLAWWGIGWGAGLERVGAVQTAMRGSGWNSALGAGANLIGFLNGLVLMLPLAYIVAFFWTSSTAIYFLLRYHVDQTELDEVAIEEEEDTYGLPPLKQDAAGVPTVADPGSPSAPVTPPPPPPPMPGDNLREGPPP